MRKNGNVEHGDVKGRKTKLNRLDKLRIKRCTNADPFLSSRKILEKCKLNKKISKWTLNRYLKTLGIMTRVARKSAVISRIHINKRLYFAHMFKEWDEKSWRDVLFSDETQIKLAPNYRILVKRPPKSVNKPRYILKHIIHRKKRNDVLGLL